METKLPDTKTLQDLLYYSPEGEVFWKSSCKRAGTQRKDGYRLISIKGIRYLEHRIIWALFGNEIKKGEQIDHIDRNPRNNKIDNLRAVTVSMNQLNCNPSKNNTSKHTGVSWHKGNKMWRAFARLNGKQKHIGYYKSKGEAAQARAGWWLRKNDGA